MLHIHCEIIMNNFLEILTAYVRDLSQKNDTGLSVKAAEIAPRDDFLFNFDQII